MPNQQHDSDHDDGEDEEHVEPPISAEEIKAAEAVVGLTFDEDEREQMRATVSENAAHLDGLREYDLPNDALPAFNFDPRPLEQRVAPPDDDGERVYTMSEVETPARPDDDNLDELAFLPVTALSAMLAAGEVSSVELTELYLARLKRFNPYLKCVITLTEELALEQAHQADDELNDEGPRTPLHGIPWGAKDLLATRYYPTTWGAMPFQTQLFDYDATVVSRLEQAGAVLAAKLTLGALAYGDMWFGGKTRNPWNLEDGSSGSSAGSAAATAAGLVGFAIGTETYGSIVSPSTRCGTTGLRPTFGRVSRHGAMALSWTMDKIGCIGRSVEDVALVFNAIYGPDGLDPFAVSAPFDWDPDFDVTSLRVGYVESAFHEERETAALDEAVLEKLEEIGVELVPIELPDMNVEPLIVILLAEAAAAFDTLTRDNLDDQLVWQDDEAWPNTFRAARFIPAVEYIQALRIRSLLIEEMDGLMSEVDAYVSPSHYGNSLFMTNLTGHPAVVVPNGFKEDGTPNSITFTAGLYREDIALALAKAYQDVTDFHLQYPPVEDYDSED